MKVAVILYEAVEPIDLAVVGVLSMAKRVTDQLEYFTVSQNGGVVRLQNGLKVETDFSFDTAPSADVLIVTGGPGWLKEADNPHMLAFLRRRGDANEIVCSVCTGAMVVGAAGLLEGKQATTKFEVVGPEKSPLDSLGKRFGATASAALVVDEGNIVTGGGVTLGIDTTLYLLQRFFGEGVANETARIMEYKASWEANQRRLPTVRSVASEAERPAA